MTCRKEFDYVVPLHLIPITIAQRIREKGGNLYRISIIRTDGHHYTVKCKCRAKIAREPAKKNEDPSLPQVPDCSSEPAPEPVFPLSGGNLRQELLTGPCDDIPGPNPLSAPPRSNPGPGLLSRQDSTMEDND